MVRVALAVLLAGVAQLAQAQLGFATESENAFSFYGGFRGGGDFVDAVTDQDLHSGPAPSFALAIDIALESKKQLQLFYSHQKTDVTPATTPSSIDRVPLKIEYLHVGGTAFFDEIGNGGYAVAGIGATRLTPDGSGLVAETRPSINIGFGYMLPVMPGLGLRFEVRGYATWIDSNGGLFCRNTSGCAVAIKGSAFYQGEGLIGLTARF